MIQISVVVRTLNEERWIEPLIRAIRSQTRRDVEVIVVDSGSVDATVALAKPLADQVLEIHGDAFSYGHALNVGIGRARGRLAAILSAHTIPMHSTWLDELARPFDDGLEISGLALSYGAQRGDGRTKLAERRDFEGQYPATSHRQRSPNYFCNNANALIRRDLWLQRPFDESLPGHEDIDWARYWMERGLEVAYRAEACVFHIHEEAWPQVYRRFRREAHARRMIGIPRPPWLRVATVESARLFGDALRTEPGRRIAQLKESILYRYWKAKGTLDGFRAPVPTPRRSLQPTDRGTYRALEIRGKRDAALVARPLPVVRPNDVLIRVDYVGICQTDLEVYDLTLGYYREGKARLPIVPGHEYSGTVVEKGANVESLEVGDAVVGECILSCGICADCLANRQTACRQRREVGVVNYDGACADYVLLPSRFVHRLPSGTSQLSACSIEPLAVVLKGFRRLQLRTASEMGRQKVLVIGAGPIGHLATRVAKHLGHRVTTFDKVKPRLDLLSGIADAMVAEPEGFQNYEYVVEATGALEMADAAITRTRTGCNILLLGFPYGPIHWNVEGVVAQDKRVIGSVGSDYETFESAIQVLPHLDVTSFNEQVVSLEQWQQAYALHQTKQFLKVKLRVSGTADDERLVPRADTGLRKPVSQ